MVVPLAVGLLDFLKALVPIVILIIWVLSQVFGEQIKRPPPAKRPRPGPPPGGRGPVVPPKNVADEIKEFLERATAPPTDEKADVDVSEPERGPPLRSTGQPAERPLRVPMATEARAPMDVEVVEPGVEGGLPKRGGGADSATQRLGGHRLADHAERLGEDVRAADEGVRQRLQRTFDHAVGQIARAEVGSPGPRSKEPSDETSQGGAPQSPLARLFQNRDGVRQAIILHEILERPEHRW
jgi:hypothetical protein